jgi:hypothetical protein
MSLGLYGTRSLSILNPADDVDVYYSYRPTRNSIDNVFGDSFVKHPNPVEILQNVQVQNMDTSVSPTLSGVYNLNLPLTIFSNKGIYNVLITPREVYGSITDSPAVLTAFPSTRGIVIKSTDFVGLTVENQGLVGFKISYFDENGEKLDDFKIITSNGLVEPIASNLSNTSQKSISYRYNDNSNLIFLTVSPNSAPVVKPNALPNIGSTGQTISISNTKFNPMLIEIEMTDTDTGTITNLLAGDQSLNLEKGLLTTFNENKDIVNQVEIFQKKSSYSGSAIYELRRNLHNVINRDESYENTFSGVGM